MKTERTENEEKIHVRKKKELRIKIKNEKWTLLK